MAKAGNSVTLNMYTYMRLIQTICSDAGLRVVYESHQVQPRTNKNTIFLPVIPHTATEEDLVNIRHWASHEAGHHRFGTDFDWFDRADAHSGSILGNVLNLVEDSRIDRAAQRIYRGDRTNQGKYSYYQAKSRVGKIMEHPDENIRKMSGLMAWDYNEVRSETVGESVLIGAQYAKAGGVDGQEAYDKVADLTDVLKNLSHFDDSEELAREIVRRVFELDPDSDEAKKNPEGQSRSEEVAEGEGEGEDGSDGDSGTFEEGNGEGQERKKAATARFVSPNPHPGEGGKGEGAALTITYDPDTLDNYVPVPPDRMTIYDYPGGDEPGSCGRDYVNLSGNSLKGIANTVRRLLQIKSKARYQHGKKKGKLSNSNLYRVTMKEAKGYNERVFKKKVTSDVQNTAVAMLVDTSRSMGGGKYSHACESSIMLNHILTDIMQIPTEIVGFSDSYQTDLFIHKKFDGRRKEEQLIESFNKAWQHGSSNIDAEAVLWEYDRLKARPEKRKIMIVLSDGQPCAGVSLLKQTVKDIEDDPDVGIVAIGIQSHSVEDFYKYHKVINDPNELEDAVLEVLRKYIIDDKLKRRGR